MNFVFLAAYIVDVIQFKYLYSVDLALFDSNMVSSSFGDECFEWMFWQIVNAGGSL